VLPYCLITRVNADAVLLEILRVVCSPFVPAKVQIEVKIVALAKPPGALLQLTVKVLTLPELAIFCEFILITPCHVFIVVEVVPEKIDEAPPFFIPFGKVRYALAPKTELVLIFAVLILAVVTPVNVPLIARLPPPVIVLEVVKVVTADTAPPLNTTLSILTVPVVLVICNCVAPECVIA